MTAGSARSHLEELIQRLSDEAPDWLQQDEWAMDALHKLCEHRVNRGTLVFELSLLRLVTPASQKGQRSRLITEMKRLRTSAVHLRDQLRGIIGSDLLVAAPPTSLDLAERLSAFADELQELLRFFRNLSQPTSCRARITAEAYTSGDYADRAVGELIDAALRSPKETKRLARLRGAKLDEEFRVRGPKLAQRQKAWRSRHKKLVERAKVAPHLPELFQALEEAAARVRESRGRAKPGDNA